MNLLVTGAGGLVGSAVCRRAAELGWRVVRLRRTANPEGAGLNTGVWWDAAANRIELGGAGPIDAVIHLAGESVAQRWTSAARRRIYESRVRGTELLGEALSRLSRPPRVILCASATGYYGDRGDEWVDEEAASGRGFLAQVCRDWEAAARRSMPADARVVSLRLGLVLTVNGGALARMLPAFRFGLGGRLGNGRHFWSWITLRDLVRVVEFALEEPALRGPVNVVSPGPVTNAEFTRELARALHRPAVLPVPRFVVRAIFGQMGQEALLAGVRVRPSRLQRAGFDYRDPELAGALRDILGEFQPVPARESGP